MRPPISESAVQLLKQFAPNETSDGNPVTDVSAVQSLKQLSGRDGRVSVNVLIEVSPVHPKKHPSPNEFMVFVRESIDVSDVQFENAWSPNIDTEDGSPIRF